MASLREVAPRILRRQWVKTGWLIGKSAYLYREPYGVIGLTKTGALEYAARKVRINCVLPGPTDTPMLKGIREGEAAGVQPEVPGLGVKQAVVTQVDRVIDAASNTFRVRLALPNGDGRVPAGARCKVDFANGQADPAPVPGPTALAPMRTP